MRKQPSATQGRWISFQAASPYTGVSVRTLQNWDKAGHLRVANVTPAGTRGRRLIDRASLDQFIESFIGAPPSKIGMNKNREAVR